MKPRTILGVLLVPPVAAAVFTLALTLACLVPRDAIEGNARRSAHAIRARGTYPRAFGIPSKAYQIDLNADAILLNVAFNVDARRPLHSAMADTIHESKIDENVYQPLGRLLSDEGIRSRSYARYWFGALSYLRPLLVAIDYPAIVALLAVAFAVLLALLLRATCRRAPAAAAVLVLFLLVTNLLTVVRILEFLHPYLLLTGLALWLLRGGGRGETPRVVAFAVAGALTAFFDLLTNPILVWGVPLLLWLESERAAGRIAGFRAAFQPAVLTGLAWGWGYAATWVSKWVVGAWVAGPSVWREALEQVAFRGGTAATNVSQMLDRAAGFAVPPRLSAPLLNVAALLEVDNPPRLKLNLAFWSLLLLAAAVVRARFPRRDVDRGYAAALALVALTPYLWYAAVPEHSMRHYWFTYRNQLITMLALGCAWCHAVDLPALGRALRRDELRAAFTSRSRPFGSG